MPFNARALANPPAVRASIANIRQALTRLRREPA
jgi:hypothetical protein